MKGETKTQAETTQSGMTALKQVINNEISELQFVRFKAQKSQKWLTENAIKIDTLKKLRNRILTEVKE